MKKLLKIPALLFAIMLIVSSCGKDTKSEAKSADILKAQNEKECILIFEEYANGGLALITEWIERYADVDVEVAIWRGLKQIGFKPPSQKATIAEAIEF